MIVADILTKAKKITNYALDATGGGLWLSDTSYRAVVPAGKRWFFLGGCVKRDVSATLEISIRDAAAKILHRMGSFTAGTTAVNYPEESYAIFPLLILDAGENVDMTFGTAQSTAAYATCSVLEVGI